MAVCIPITPALCVCWRGEDRRNTVGGLLTATLVPVQEEEWGRDRVTEKDAQHPPLVSVHTVHMPHTHTHFQRDGTELEKFRSLRRCPCRRQWDAAPSSSASVTMRWADGLTTRPARLCLATFPTVEPTPKYWNLFKKFSIPGSLSHMES